MKEADLEEALKRSEKPLADWKQRALWAEAEQVALEKMLRLAGEDSCGIRESADVFGGYECAQLLIVDLRRPVQKVSHDVVA